MQNSKGFTLIEMIMVIVLIGIVAAIIAVPLSQGVKGWFAATSREGISQSGRIGIERMAREIRNTARKSDNTPCISAATATSFTFSDINGNLTSCADTTFSWAGAGNPIMRGANNLADNVSALNIQYYGKNNNITATLATICRLSIEITSTQGGETLQKYEEVYLSNMRISGGCIP